jgi:hypothetical protein
MKCSTTTRPVAAAGERRYGGIGHKGPFARLADRVVPYVFGTVALGCLGLLYPSHDASWSRWADEMATAAFGGAMAGTGVAIVAFVVAGALDATLRAEEGEGTWMEALHLWLSLVALVGFPIILVLSQ